MVLFLEKGTQWEITEEFFFSSIHSRSTVGKISQ